VQQAIAMKITGHKTGSIFRRYLIVDEELLAQAAGAVADYLGTPAPAHGLPAPKVVPIGPAPKCNGPGRRDDGSRRDGP
jgi:hypothetical protein